MNRSYDKYKILYDHAWNQYNIYYQGYFIRYNKLNMVGAVSSIFIVSEITIAIGISKLFFIATLPLLLTLVIFIMNLAYKKEAYYKGEIHKGIQIPWHGKSDLNKLIRKGKAAFYKEQIDDIMFAADTLYEYKQFSDYWISVAIRCIGVSATILFVVFCLIIFCGVCPTPVCCSFNKLFLK